MAVITSYTTLVNNLIAVAEDDGQEFADFIPTAISLAEDRLIRECDFVDLEEKDTGNLTASNRSLTKPTGYKFPLYFAVINGNTRILLKRKTDDFLIDYWPNTALAGTPKYYADDSATTLALAPTPDQAYSYELKYKKQPTKLSTSNATNYFVTYCPDLLYHACMVELAKFMKAWTQVSIWEQEYTILKESWNTEQAQKRVDDGSKAFNPEGGQNTLKHNLGSGSSS